MRNSRDSAPTQANINYSDKGGLGNNQKKQLKYIHTYLLDLSFVVVVAVAVSVCHVHLSLANFGNLSTT